MQLHRPVSVVTKHTAPRQTRFRLFCHFGAQDLDILPAFFRHYDHLGVSSFHFVIHGDETLAGRVEACGQGRDVAIAQVYQGPFDEDVKCDALTKAIRPVAGEWVLLADTDEFLELPYRDLPTTIRALNAFGLTSLPAQLIDRVTDDGSLPEVDADEDPERLFPSFSRLLYSDMGLEDPPWLVKFPLFLVTDATVVRRGHHLPPNGTSPLHVPIRAAVHHFKWRAALLRTLERREKEGGNREVTLGCRRWLEDHDYRLPTSESVHCSRQTLFHEGLIRRPNRREISRLVIDTRRARLAVSGGPAEVDLRLGKAVEKIEQRWARCGADSLELRPKASGLLIPRGHIAFVTFELAGLTRTGGIGTAVATVAERLAADGHRISILFCSLKRAPPGNVWIDYWKSRGVQVDALVESADVPFNHHRGWSELSYEVLRWLQRIDPDIVHLHDCLGLGAAAAAAKRQGLALTNSRIIVEAHGDTSWHKRGNLQHLSVDELYTVQAETEQFRHADVVIAPSAYMLDYLRARGTPLPVRSHVLRYMRSAEARGSPVLPSSDWRPREVVFFGRVEFRKGIDTFCSAISIVAESGRQDFTVTLLGRIGFGDELASFVREASSSWPVPYRVITGYGTADAIRYLRSRPAVAVMPSRQDNLPFTVYECLENGIPFFTSSHGGAAELIARSDHERVLRADSAEDLAAALTDALDNGHAPAKLAFDPDDVELRWLAWFGELLEEVRQGRQRNGDVQRSSPRPTIGLYGDSSAAVKQRALAAALHQKHTNCYLRVSGTVASGLEIDPTTVGDGSANIGIETEIGECDGRFMNRTVAESDSSHVLFCHASVVLVDEAAKALYAAIEEYNADAAVCGYWLHIVFADAPENGDADRFVVPAPAGPLTLCPVRNVFGAPVFLISKDAFDRVGGVCEDPQLRGVEHWDLLNRLTLIGGKIASVPVPMATHYVASAEHPLLRPSEQVAERLLAPFVDFAPEALRDAVRILPQAIVSHDHPPDLRTRVQLQLVQVVKRSAAESTNSMDANISRASHEEVKDENGHMTLQTGARSFDAVYEELFHVTRMYNGLSLSRMALLRQFLRLNIDRLLRRRSAPPW